jgi:hypothetical protein
MKRKINNRIYNTETAKLVGSHFYIRKRCNIICCYLYQKRNGEYFIKCRGGDTYHQWYDFLTDDNAYNEPLYHKYFIGEFLVPLVTSEDIEYYSKKAIKTNYYNNSKY